MQLVIMAGRALLNKGKAVQTNFGSAGDYSTGIRNTTGGLRAVSMEMEMVRY